MKEPKVRVGIMNDSEIRVVFHGGYSYKGSTIRGEHQVVYESGAIRWNGRIYPELVFEPVDESASFFELKDVTIGINFHWERKECQSFRGALKFIIENENITAVNIVPIENYLESVISSEMSAEASEELLKAHAVISRSWLMAQINKTKGVSDKAYNSFITKGNEHICWYDHEDHDNFDVCADDHCQRYQGITRVFTETAVKAVVETRGQVLMSEGSICDARFSKCCGGALEEFHNCWEDVNYSYLRRKRDCVTKSYLPDFRHEEQAERWIRISPEAFCNTQNKRILSQVLNNYDQETTDFYRWKVEYTVKELSELVFERTGIDFGTIVKLVPAERGTSGRIVKLKVIGTKCSMTIGKELEIRRVLSHSHLYSSAFVIDKEDDKFILTGAGWGHGVGLCQIGAAVMGNEGYAYNDILLHYYVGATVEKIY